MRVQVGGWVDRQLPDFAECISLEPLDVFSPLGSSRPKVMQHRGHFHISFALYGLAHEPKTYQINYHWGPDFAEHISLKPLDKFTRFKVQKKNSKYVYCQYIEIHYVYNCQHYVPYTLQSNRYEMEMGHVARQPIPEPPPWPGVMVPTPRPRDHATQPWIRRPKMKLRTTEPQMSRSGPTQSRSTRIAVPASAARTTRPRCPIFPQAP